MNIRSMALRCYSSGYKVSKILEKNGTIAVAARNSARSPKRSIAANQFAIKLHQRVNREGTDETQGAIWCFDRWTYTRARTCRKQRGDTFTAVKVAECQAPWGYATLEKYDSI